MVGFQARQRGSPSTIPPETNSGVLADVYRFLLRRPACETLLRFGSAAEREDHSRRILQRVGVSVERYTVLNIHRIGIHAPVLYAFEELSRWGADAAWWPNGFAAAVRVDGAVDHLQINLLSWPLFEVKALRIVARPCPSDFDNARYLLYECRGGYPIGIFVMYVRSPIAERGESEPAQLFFAVGFDFYGRKSRSGFHPLNRIWEALHNRATANILNCFKRVCERRVDAREACPE